MRSRVMARNDFGIITKTGPQYKPKIKNHYLTLFSAKEGQFALLFW